MVTNLLLQILAPWVTALICRPQMAASQKVPTRVHIHTEKRSSCVLWHKTTTTSPAGRNTKTEGPPIKVSEMLAGLENTVYLERVAVNTPKNIRKTKKAIQKAFEIQKKNIGFTLVEILSPCPTNWRMDTIASCKWIDDVMMKEFPLGVIKEVKC